MFQNLFSVRLNSPLHCPKFSLSSDFIYRCYCWKTQLRSRIQTNSQQILKDYRNTFPTSLQNLTGIIHSFYRFGLRSPVTKHSDNKKNHFNIKSSLLWCTPSENYSKPPINVETSMYLNLLKNITISGGRANFK